jgi:glycerol-3-phosphate acyltransferase PlsY
MLPARALILTVTLLLAVAYGLGSLPFSVWTGKLFFGIDVREHGSGNAGATNTWRVLGWRAGLPVLLLDTGKGLAATGLPFLFAAWSVESESFLWMRMACGGAAALGHIFPVFAGFRGGKAVATLLGVVVGLMPLAAAGSLALFIIVFLASRMVSLGSLLGAVALPFMSWLLPGGDRLPLLLFSSLIAILVVLTHRKNIQRIIRGKESRVSFRKDRKVSR